MTDDQLHELARAARAAVSVSAEETERALREITDDVTDAAPMAHPTPRSAEARRPWRWLAVAAATVAVVAAGLMVVARRGQQVTTIEPAVTDVPTGPGTGTTEAVPASTAAPASSLPATIVPEGDTQRRDLSALGSAAWEGANIDRSCTDGFGCTQVVIGPTGVPVSYDRAARTLTRHVRDDGAFVSAELPESFEHATVVAVGPDDVVYLHVDRGGMEVPSDLVAVAMAPGDAGRVIETVSGAGDALAGAELVPTPAGLVAVAQPDAGPADPATIAMGWVDRDPGDDDSPLPGPDPYPNGVRQTSVDTATDTVTVDTHEWRLTGLAAEIEPTRLPRVVPTFDGGFIAGFEYLQGVAADTVIVRGHADGSVEEWAIPGAGAPDVVPEPQGTVLLADGNRFLRVAPFAERPNGWGGELQIDFEIGAATPVGLAGYLASLDWSQPQAPWDRGYIAFANAVAGRLGSPAALRTIQVVKSDAEGGRVVVTTEHDLDDSAYGTELRMLIGFDRSVDVFGWGSACQPGRGHQDYRAASCT